MKFPQPKKSQENRYRFFEENTMSMSVQKILSFFKPKPFTLKVKVADMYFSQIDAEKTYNNANAKNIYKELKNATDIFEIQRLYNLLGEYTLENTSAKKAIQRFINAKIK